MKAQFVSKWDDGVEIKTSCQYDESTNTAYDIESVEADGLDILIEEYVELPDGTIISNMKIEY